MRIFTSFLVFAMLVTSTVTAQQGFQSITHLNPVSISTNTGEKPQSKVWTYEGKHWAVLPNSSGTYIWRLDGTSWNSVLKLSSSTFSKADCKVVGNTVHILLLTGESGDLVSVEYDPNSNSYVPWSNRGSTVSIWLDDDVETATIDVDGTGKMWAAFDGDDDSYDPDYDYNKTDNVYVRWSNPPYDIWSPRQPLYSGISGDDICDVIALQGKIGVFWSNQNTKRFGFKTHTDGANSSSWSSDEVPASQSALNLGHGMADDHMNVSMASDGYLYCAVKTSYDNSSYPEIAMLVRHPSGSWENLHEVSGLGTRPVAILNESSNKIRVVYTSQDGGGNILYKESSKDNISFGSQRTLINGTYNNSTSTKDNFSSEIVILASNDTEAVGVLAIDNSSNSAPDPPVLSSPADLTSEVPLAAGLTWNASQGATSYEVQVSEESNFASTVYDENNIAVTSAYINGLNANTTYYWKVRAVNSAGISNWSDAWRFATTSDPNPSSPLVAHWTLDDGSGTSLQDDSDYGNDGTTHGGSSWVNVGSGTALHFDGASQYATVTNSSSLNITQTITMAAWVRPEKMATQYLIKKAEYANADGYELSLGSDGKIFFRFNQDSSGDTYRLESQTSYPFDGNTWVHIAATFDGAVMKMYINGVEDNSLTLSSPQWININQLPLSIGAGINDFRGFQGILDDIYIYNEVLSPAEIATLADPFTVPAPVLTSPENATVDVPVPVTISWEAFQFADNYTLEVAGDLNFNNIVNSQSGLTQPSAQVSGLDNNSTYYWRVISHNAGGDSPGSPIWNFTTVPAIADAPMLSAPSDLSTDVALNETLSWSTANGADSYQVQVSELSDFSTTVLDQNGITGTTATLSGLSNGITYYWRVLSHNAGGDSAWSSTWSFTTVPAIADAPVLSAPSDLSTDVALNETLSWIAANGADSYQVQVSELSDFSTTVLDQNGITGTTATLSGLSNGITYYWRVLSHNAGGDSAWSSTWSFTTVPAIADVPTLSAPLDLSTDVALDETLSWNAANGADSYTLEIATDNTFTTPIDTQTGLTGTTATAGKPC